MKTVSFYFADHLLVGQLYTNPKSDRSFYHVWKCHNVQRARSEVYRCTTHAPYRSKWWQQDHCWIATNNRDVPGVMKTKLPATVMVFGVVPSEGHIMPPHIFEVGVKVNIKVYVDVLKSVVIPWCNQVAGGRPWVWQQDSVPVHKSKETQVWLQKECYNFVPFPHCPPPSPTWTRWTTSFGHTSKTSPTWPLTIPKPAWSPPSAEYSPSSRQRLLKRHDPTTGTSPSDAVYCYNQGKESIIWTIDRTL